MIKYEVKTTMQAKSQIREIARYIAVKLHNPEAATRLTHELEKEIQKLRINPEMFSLVNEECWRNEGVRWTKVKSYLIYFYIDKDNGFVQVFAVINQRRDRKKTFSYLSDSLKGILKSDIDIKEAKEEWIKAKYLIA